MVVRSLMFLARRRGLLAAALFVATCVAAASATRVRFDFTPQALFGSADDTVAFSEEAKRAFGYEDSRLMIVLEATGPRDVLTADLLNWQGDVARRLEALPRVERVDAVATLQTPQVSFENGLSIRPAPIIQKFPATAETESRVRGQLDRSRMIEGSLVSHDRQVGAMYVVFDPEARDVAAMRRLVESVRETIDTNPPPDDFRVRYSGLPGIRVSVVEHLMADQAFLFPLAGLVFLVALAAVFRSVAGVLVPLGAVLIGLIWTLGIVTATGEAFNIVTNVLPILILIVGVSNSIHLAVRYTEEWESAGGDRRLAARRTIESMSVPCLLTLVTSALGFVSLTTARSRVLQMFGWHAAIGMACLYLSVLLAFAVLLPSWKVRRASPDRRIALPKLARWTATAGDAVTARPRVVLASGAALVVVCVFAARNLTVNSSITETYDPEHPETQTIRLVERSLGGVLPLEVIFTADEPGRFLEPAVYRKVADVGTFARSQREATSSQSYVDLYQEIYANFRRDPLLRQEMPGDDEEGYHRLRQNAAQAERSKEATQPRSFLTEDGTQARMIVRVRDVGTRRTLAMIRRIEARLDELFPPGCGVAVRLTGDAYLNAVAMDGFVRDLFSSLLTAAASVFVLVALLFRSLRVGLIAALPNLVPFAITLAWMGIRGYDLNAGNVAVFAISLGLTVDNSIHFLSRFKEESRFAGHVPQAVHLTYLGAGQAMVLNNLLQAAGLVVLLGSSFVPTQRFAELMGVTMAGTLIGDLMLLPACVTLFWKSDGRDASRTEIDSRPDHRPDSGELAAANGEPLLARR